MNQTLVAPAIEAPSEAETAFEALYRASRDDVYAYVAGMLRDRSAAEDVTAQAFERAYRRRASFKPERGSRRAWLFGIARNAALDELRRRGRHTKLTGEPEDVAAAGAHEEAVEASLRRSMLNAALAKLSRRERELIALKYFAGLANAEIADVIGVSESNAGTRLHRAMEKLREACDEG
ncbi:MAG: sigma-70 family RNA polymerase sigma factor [Solirubrobacterales bacterium]